MLAPPPIVPALKNEVKEKEESYNEIRLEKKDEPSGEAKVDIGIELFAFAMLFLRVQNNIIRIVFSW